MDTTRTLQTFMQMGFVFLFLLSLSSFFPPCTFGVFFFKLNPPAKFSPAGDLLELRSAKCPGMGDYKRPRIFRGNSHTSDIVTLQASELLEGWKFWRWEISEVPLYEKETFVRSQIRLS